MSVSKHRLAILIFAASIVLNPARGAEPISAEQVAKLHALIKPGVDEEKWTQIPWQSSLWEARQKAAKEGKPILLWEMDGNPLGCV